MTLIAPRSSFRTILVTAAALLLAPLLLLAVAAAAAPIKDNPEGGEALSYRPGTPTSGRVVALGLSNFQSALDDHANPIWLLKFYAPW
jgi:hypothetical protein